MACRSAGKILRQFIPGETLGMSKEPSTWLKQETFQETGSIACLCSVVILLSLLGAQPFTSPILTLRKFWNYLKRLKARRARHNACGLLMYAYMQFIRNSSVANRRADMRLGPSHPSLNAMPGDNAAKAGTRHILGDSDR